MADDTEPQTTLQLTERKLPDAGVALGLKPGDVLLALNGHRFIGNVKQLNNRFFLAEGKPVAMTFRRGVHDFTVLATHPALGQWEPTEGLPQWQGERIDPLVMRNFEIFRSRNLTYDLHPTKPATLALFCPPLWMLYQRLWVPAAAVSAAVALCAMVYMPVAPLVYGLAGVALWSSGHGMVRVDRIRMGFAPVAMIAALTEREARATYEQMDPRARFIYDPVPEAGSDQTAPDTTA